MFNVFKALTTGFFVMLIVILIICSMEVANELNSTEFVQFCTMVVFGIIGCFAAAVGINLINDKG